jgi:hypothetical protein
MAFGPSIKEVVEESKFGQKWEWICVKDCHMGESIKNDDVFYGLKRGRYLTIFAKSIN